MEISWSEFIAKLSSTEVTAVAGAAQSGWNCARRCYSTA